MRVVYLQSPSHHKLSLVSLSLNLLLYLIILLVPVGNNTQFSIQIVRTWGLFLSVSLSWAIQRVSFSYAAIPYSSAIDLLSQGSYINVSTSAPRSSSPISSIPSFVFDGVTSTYIASSSSGVPKSSILSTNFTMTYWINQAIGNNGTILSKNSANGSVIYSIVSSTINSNIYVSFVSTDGSFNVIPFFAGNFANAWHHLAITVSVVASGSQVSLYLDGLIL